MEERKSKEERSEGRRTLFVRNLPYSTTDDQLTSVFAEYGAVKTCFTVKNKGTLFPCCPIFSDNLYTIFQALLTSVKAMDTCCLKRGE